MLPPGPARLRSHPRASSSAGARRAPPSPMPSAARPSASRRACPPPRADNVLELARVPRPKQPVHSRRVLPHPRHVIAQGRVCRGVKLVAAGHPAGAGQVLERRGRRPVRRRISRQGSVDHQPQRVRVPARMQVPRRASSPPIGRAGDAVGGGRPRRAPPARQRPIPPRPAAVRRAAPSTPLPCAPQSRRRAAFPAPPRHQHAPRAAESPLLRPPCRRLWRRRFKPRGFGGESGGAPTARGRPRAGSASDRPQSPARRHGCPAPPRPCAPRQRPPHGGDR